MKKLYLPLHRFLTLSYLPLTLLPKEKTILFLLFLTLINPISSYAQPQWKFHIAFEDGTGAKDTIWMIWDSTATSGIDLHLSEGKPVWDHSKFNVFVDWFNPDSTKTHALPFDAISLDIEVKAFNYKHPITIKWDSSLFSKTLPPPYEKITDAIINNDYFFSVNNWQIAHLFNMLWADSVYAPSYTWGAQVQFPMSFGISRGDLGIGINSIIAKNKNKGIYSNPFNNIININKHTNDHLVLFIYDLMGRLTRKADIFKPNNELYTGDMPDGLYFIRLENTEGKIIDAQKFIKYSNL